LEFDGKPVYSVKIRLKTQELIQFNGAHSTQHTTHGT